MGTESTVREGKPIIKRELLTALSSAVAWGVVGGVVERISRSR